MNYARMVIEKEAPEEYGYDRIRYNLSESSIADQKLSDIGLNLPDLTLFYGEHRGERALRDLIAEQDAGLSPDHVLVTAGAAGALFIIATSLLSEADHLVVVRPNYATNIETPKAIGCGISYIDLSFDEGFAVDLAKVAAALRPNTRYISVTCPHNPTGTIMSRADLDALIALAESHGCYLLVDETYRDLSYGQKLPAAASLSPRAISVSSLSKAFGIPGIRIGWLVTRDAALYEQFLAAKEQIGICGSVIDEAIARTMLEGRERFPGQADPRNDGAARHRAGLDRRRAAGRLGSARRRRRRLSPPECRQRFRSRPLLRRPARTARHLCRPGPLVRHAEAVLPRRLRLAHGGAAQGRSRCDFGGAAGVTGAPRKPCYRHVRRAHRR